MKSLVYVIITLYMLNYVLSEYCLEIKPKKASDCTDHELTVEEKNYFEEELEEELDDFDSCCYITYKEEGKDESICLPFIKSRVNNKETIDEIKYDLETDEVKIECEDDSNWLSLSLTFLFFGLLF